jgi:hypothetical protein
MSQVFEEKVKIEQLHNLWYHQKEAEKETNFSDKYRKKGWNLEVNIKEDIHD